MSRAFFIAGTDTGVGKTKLACALLQRGRELGLSTAAVKPIAAGAELASEGLRNDDAVQLQQYCSENLAYEEINPVCFEEPVAPHLAAMKHMQYQSVQELKRACEAVLDKAADLTVIEGAGGWLVPVNDTETLADLAASLKLPVILVVGMRLGCLNHALLTVAAIRQSRLLLAGWVANQIDPHMTELEGNLQTLQQRISAPLLGHIPYLPDKQPSELASHLNKKTDQILTG